MDYLIYFLSRGINIVSGGCNTVNWLSQTRRNLTIEYLNLNFVTTPKLTPLHSFYVEKVFVSCVWLVSVSQVHARPSLFDTNVLQHTVSDLKLSTRSVLVNISNQLKRKNVFPRKMQRKQLKVWNWFIRHRVGSHFWILCFFLVNCLGGWNQ